MRNYIVEFASAFDTDDLIRQHYLQKWPAIPTSIVGLLNEEQTRYLGVIVFALPPRETMKRYGVSCAWELARLFIVDETPKNTETWFISRALKLIRLKYPNVELIVSYANPSVGHQGIIYRAGNWISDGMTDKNRYDYRSGNRVFSRRSQVLVGPAFAPIEHVKRVSKHRFLYWMKDHERKRQAKDPAFMTRTVFSASENACE